MRATIATVILLLNINLAKATTSKEELIQRLDELITATNQASFTQPDKYKGSLVQKEKLVKADNLTWDYLQDYLTITSTCLIDECSGI